MKQANKRVAWAVAAGLVTVVGCQSATPPSGPQGQPQSALPARTPLANGIRPDVTDIPRAAAAEPAAMPAAYQVAAADTPTQAVIYSTTTVSPLAIGANGAAAARPFTPASASLSPAVGSNSHVVRHGETLYSIARQSYGDGKQWQRIAMANPGLTPSSLKVGQSIVVP